MKDKISKKEIGISTLKGLIGAIPYAGTALNEVLFEYRSRLKQNRVNKFIEELSKYFESIDENSIDLKNIKSEQFSDLFESILLRVVNNRSETKLHYFKNILINQIKNKTNINFDETFLDLITRLNEDQINILNTYKKVKLNYISTNDNLENIDVLQGGTKKVISEFRYHSYYNLEPATYLFYVQDLVSKSLLKDIGIGRFTDVDPYEILEITHFGLEFLDFIENK